MWQEIKKRGRLGKRQVILLDETDSTNSYAANLGRQGVENGTVVMAESQKNGRGRLGRQWHSPSGQGLYFSMVWHSKLAPENLAKTTITAGLALCRAIEKLTTLSPQIKWPNDLLSNNKKIGGILTENCGRHKNHYLLIIGIGLNVNTEKDEFPTDLRKTASSLYLSSGQKYDRAKILGTILHELDKQLMTLEQGEFSKILADWRKRDATLDKTTTWLTPNGKVITGNSLGVDNQGLLHIREDGGNIHEVLSGDLSLEF